MPELAEELAGHLEAAVAPGYRGRLLDRGLARGLIWRDGVLPAGAPPFAPSLTVDLLDYAYAVLAMALRLRSVEANAPVLQRALFIAGQAIEAAVHRGEPGRIDRGFHRVTAAVAFHLARYAALAYSMLPVEVESANLAPTERVLVHLLRRSLDEMHTLAIAWLLDDEHQDARIAERLRENPQFDETDAANAVITTSFMRALALFDHAIVTGEAASADEARRRLLLTAEAARHLNAVNHWWTCTMAFHLIDDLWEVSLHRRIPMLPPGTDDSEQWNSLRQSYIQRLRAAKRSTIALWPSQLDAARRAIDPGDRLVVALPTGAGKTRIAELCILRALASNRRVVYITPLRALSAQVERDLAGIFAPLGFSVSTLYGSAGIVSGDAQTFREGKIVVATPEKLDFALRNDPSILDDVGLVVLDEGHMLGPDEREVRYEALVQRLLRRSDAGSRRLVCLSALFPSPDQMSDLIAWLRQDEPGTAVFSAWRPTRQRYGILQWLRNAARLDLRMEQERPYVSRFVEAKPPPPGSRRRKDFPSDKNDLTLAAAWQFIDQDKNVLIYCALRKSVEPLGRLAIKCIEQGVLTPLRSPNQYILDAMAIGGEWLGADHPAVQCLRYGVVLHHGTLPHPFLIAVEQLLRSGDCPLTIASPTLGKGLNLSASVLLVPSIWREGQIIPSSELANVAGRAGRAFVDLDGLVLHVVWEDTPRKRRWAIRQWDNLVAGAKAPELVSGLLQLTASICQRIADRVNVQLDEVVDYITGHGEAWDYGTPQTDEESKELDRWERDIASLDAAILGLLDAGIDTLSLDTELGVALEGSLFTRQLARLEASAALLRREVLLARACHIWSHTSQFSRRGYHAAGVGLKAGQFLDDHIEYLVTLLLQAEVAINDGDSATAAEAIVLFARLVFETEPFRPIWTMPEVWESALRGWLEGQPASDVIGMAGDVGVVLLQEAFTYRLPWAMEAVRVHGMAVSQEYAELIRGYAALAAEVGSANHTVITLLRAGLNSRETATAAIARTGAAFRNRTYMNEWLATEEIVLLSHQADWPTPQTHHAWLQFYESQRRPSRAAFVRRTQVVSVEWFGEAPHPGDRVVVEPDRGLVLTPDLVKLGKLRSTLATTDRDIISVQVAGSADAIILEYFGAPIV